MSLSRRQLLLAAGASAACGRGARSAAPSSRRHVVVMFDGLGPDYVSQSHMPTLHRWMKDGFSKEVDAVMPSVTNANNASICCNAWPSEHGITGNSYLDERTGEEHFMERADLVLAPTLFERLAPRGVRSVLLTSKKKTAFLLNRGASLVVAAEEPPAEIVRRYGLPPSIYSREINIWLGHLAVDLLGHRTDLGCIYLHTTDFPMHAWPPEHPQSQKHLADMDEVLAEMERAAPDAIFYLTADHGLGFKSRAWDLEQVLRREGVPVRRVISAERDRYPRHHKGLGGTAWVYMKSGADPAETSKAARVVGAVTGVEEVLTRRDAAAKYRLMPSRIGDLVVTADAQTVFGALEGEAETEALEPTYRSHGSRFEARVPLVIHPAPRSLVPYDYRANVDLLRNV